MPNDHTERQVFERQVYVVLLCMVFSRPAHPWTAPRVKKGVLRGLWVQRQDEAVVWMPPENKAQYTIIMNHDADDACHAHRDVQRERGLHGRRHAVMEALTTLVLGITSHETCK